MTIIQKTEPRPINILPEGHALGTEMQRAIGANDLNALKGILTPDAGTVLLPNSHLPIIYAIRKGSLEAVQLILQKCLIDLNEKDSQNLTAIDHAIIGGNPKIISLVLASLIGSKFRGAVDQPRNCNQAFFNEVENAVKILRRPDLDAASSFQKAAFIGDLVELKRLRSSCDINQADGKGWTALHYACLGGGKEEVVAWLLEAGADINCLTFNRETPLHFAAIAGSSKVVEVLSSFAKLNFNVRNAKGYTPLHLAAVIDDFHTAVSLVKKGADPLDKTFDSTPLDLMVKRMHETAAKRDSLKLDLSSILMCSSIVGALVMHLCGKDDAAEGFHLLATFTALHPWKNKIEPVNPLLVLAFFGIGIKNSFVRNGFVKEFLTILGVSVTTDKAIRELSACWKNRHLETARPLRNAIIHLINGGYIIHRVFRVLVLWSQQREEERQRWWDNYRQQQERSRQERQQFFEQRRKEQEERFKQWSNFYKQFHFHQEQFNHRSGNFLPCQDNDIQCFEAAADVLRKANKPAKPEERETAMRVLGFTPNVSTATCKKSFKQRSKKWHPNQCSKKIDLIEKDKCGQICNKIQTILGNAYTVLNRCDSESLKEIETKNFFI